MALFRSVRMDYEKAIRMGQLHGIRPKVDTAGSLPLGATGSVKNSVIQMD